MPSYDNYPSIVLLVFHVTCQVVFVPVEGGERRVQNIAEQVQIHVT